MIFFKNVKFTLNLINEKCLFLLLSLNFSVLGLNYLKSCEKQDVLLRWGVEDASLDECTKVRVEWSRNKVLFAESMTTNGTHDMKIINTRFINRFYKWSLNQVVLQKVRVEDSGLYAYTLYCDEKALLESEALELNVTTGALLEASAERRIQLYEGRDLEIKLPKAEYCMAERILWLKSDEIFASNIIREQEIKITYNPYMKDILFVDPFTLRFNKVNVLHGGYYNVSVLYSDHSISKYTIHIVVLRIGGFVYTNPHNLLKETMCTGANIKFPWKVSQPLTQFIHNALEIHLFLKFLGANSLYDPFQQPLTLFNMSYRTRDFSQIIRNNELSYLFHSYYSMDFLTDKHVGLYIIQMILKMSKGVLYKDTLKPSQPLDNSDDTQKNSRNSIKNNNKKNKLNNIDFINKKKHYVANDEKLISIQGDGDVDYEWVSVEPSFYILSASHVEHLSDSLEFAYKGPYPLESSKLCYHLTSQPLCSILPSTPINHLSFMLNFHIDPFSCQYFVRSLFNLKVYRNDLLLTEALVKLGNMKKPFVILSTDYTSDVQKVVIYPTTTSNISGEADELFMNHFTHEIEKVSYEMIIYFKDGVTSDDVRGRFEAVGTLKRAGKRHFLCESNVIYVFFITESLLSSRQNLATFLENNFRIELITDKNGSSIGRFKGCVEVFAMILMNKV